MITVITVRSCIEIELNHIIIDTNKSKLRILLYYVFTENVNTGSLLWSGKRGDSKGKWDSVISMNPANILYIHCIYLI